LPLGFLIDRVSLSAQARLGSESSNLCLPHSWDNRHALTCLALTAVFNKGKIKLTLPYDFTNNIFENSLCSV
jgi:hypothetical protein